MKSLSKRLEEFKAGKRPVYQKPHGPGHWTDDLEYVRYSVPTRRSAGKAHEINRGMSHTGWFADNDQDQLYVGEVWHLPHGKFLAGYVDDFGGTAIFDGRVYDDKSDAAYAGDSMAESAAEKSREFYAKDRAEQDILQARDDIHELNKEAMEVLRELKGVQLPPALCAAVRGNLQTLLNLRKKAFCTIKRRQDDYWSAVPS